MGSAGGSGRESPSDGRQVSAPALTASGWGLGVLVTAVILGTPYLVFGYHSPSLHLVLGTLDACVAVLVAYLVYGRYRRSRLVTDLLLAQGLLLLAVAGLGLVLVLHLVDPEGAGTLETWLPLALRTLGAVLIAGAALAGGRRTERPTDRHDRRARGQAGAWLALAPWVVVALLVLLAWLLRDDLPAALSSDPPASAQRPIVTGHPLLLAAHGVTAVLFLVASVAFTVRAVRRHDELMRWLGPACALGGFARVNYVLFPSLYSDWIYTGDLLRTGSYLLLLVGAAREISQYWPAQARLAVLEDRRRLARELHDGLVQEIAFIRAEARTMEPAGERAERIVSACDRALDEARAAVDALGRAGDEPLGRAVERAARQVAERYGARAVVEVDPAVSATDEQRHGLVRITREAVSNAVRHGRVAVVRVRLERDVDGCRLVVSDDGPGFDVEATGADGNGFGLVSMRERADGLPGDLTIVSSPTSGTSVEVSW